MAGNVAKNNAFNKYIDMMNNMLDSPNEKLSEFQIAQLKKEANKLEKPYSFSCLAALYSNIRNNRETIEYAKTTLNYRDFDTTYNALASLFNIKEFNVICDLYLKNQWINYHNSLLKLCIKSSIYSINIEVFDMINKNINVNDSEIKEDLYYFNNISEYIKSFEEPSKLKEYIYYAYNFMFKKIKNENDLQLICEELADENDDFLSIKFYIKNLKMDDAIDMEFDLQEHLSLYYDSFIVKNALSFQVEGDM
ncbi:TPA: hypothetical protein ACX6Q4_002544 [Photobacterium damselae]|uniref:hypothetical protein n=1 Tax=Photobacterium damselae TaxID=38293 RepID=UPI0030F3C03C